MGFKDTLQNIVNKSFEEKVRGAQTALNECFAILTRHDFNKDEAAIVVLTFLSTAIASDGKFSVPEQEMIDAIFDKDISAFLKNIDSESYQLMDKLVDSLNSDEKTTFCLLAIFVAAVDDTINHDELTYIIKLME